MKNLKVGILAFAVLGLVLLFVPENGGTRFAFLQLAGISYLVPVLGGFVAAAAMGAMAIKQRRLLKWQAAVATAGFAAVFVRLKVWERLKHITDASLIGKLFVVAVIGGLVISILGIFNSED